MMLNIICSIIIFIEFIIRYIFIEDIVISIVSDNHEDMIHKSFSFFLLMDLLVLFLILATIGTIDKASIIVYTLYSSLVMVVLGIFDFILFNKK